MSRFYFIHLGNIRQTLNENGGIAAAQDYYLYGEVLRGYTNGLANEKYKFSEKERDVETGFDCFGSRYYDGALGIFLSCDAFTSKYPSLSPYQYAANNPLRFVDVNGDSLWVGGDSDMSLSYLQSLVPSSMVGRITVGANGLISFNTKGIDVTTDAGATLVNDLVNSDKKYLFAVVDDNDLVMYKSNTSGFLHGMSPNDTRTGILNLSTTAVNSSGVGYSPTGGYDGAVYMGKGSWTFFDGAPQPTSNISFHELAENYYRTDFNMPYATGQDAKTGLQYGGAHERAILESNRYGNQVGEAGKGIYIKH